MTSASSSRVIAQVGHILEEGEVVSFSWRDSIGMISEGFVFRKNSHLHAYKNVCRHQPLTLDYGDGDVFTEDGQYLLCRNHGALFQPESGFCVDGPCQGASLFQFEVQESNGTTVIIDSAPEMELE